MVEGFFKVYPKLRATWFSGDMGSHPLKNSGKRVRMVKVISSFFFVFSKLYLQPRKYFNRVIASIGKKNVNQNISVYIKKILSFLVSLPREKALKWGCFFIHSRIANTLSARKCSSSESSFSACLIIFGGSVVM